MAMKTLITNELFSDFIEYRYRGYLKITGATESNSDLLEVSARLREGYHSQAREHLLRACRDEGKQACTDVELSVVLANRYDLAIDVTATDANASVRFDALMAAPGNASGSQPDYIPIIFVNKRKGQQRRRIAAGAVCFGSHSLARMSAFIRKDSPW